MWYAVGVSWDWYYYRYKYFYFQLEIYRLTDCLGKNERCTVSPQELPGSLAVGCCHDKVSVP